MWYKLKRILIYPDGVTEKQVYPKYEWKPNANTLAYYPLTSTTTVNDMSGNNRNLTNNWATFWTYAGVDCVLLPSADTKKLYWTLPLTWNQTFTVNVYIQRIWNSTQSQYSWQIFVLWDIGTNWATFWTSIKNSTAANPNTYLTWTRWTDITSTDTNTTWKRELITVINDTSNVKLYKNWTLIMDNSMSFNIGSTNFAIWSFSSSSQRWWFQNFYWYMSRFIVEDKVRTAQEIQDYYNQTKSNYWL